MNAEMRQRIEQRAYALWQAEGQPHGKHEEHWQRAAREIEAEERTSAGRSGNSRRAASPQRKRKTTG
jgi:Protein of unknown function (DUF2934)